jgi:hypothetical protein
VSNVTKLVVMTFVALALLVTPLNASAGRQRTVRRPRPDKTPPTTPVVDGPSETEDTEPSFVFSSSDRRTPSAAIRFRCSIDGPTLHACNSEYSEHLGFGKHILRVRALDRAGNRSRIRRFEFVVIGAWDAFSDFSHAPNQQNPNPDRYGNLTWSYMWSDGRIHDPTRYRLFTHYTVVNADREQWDSGDSHSTPYPPWPLVGVAGGGIVMHPYNGQFAVLGWKSPITGTVGFEGSFRSVDPCSRGIDWTVDKGATIVLSGGLGGGQGQSFNASLPVSSGDVLYFVVDPGPDDLCDTTAVAVTIRTSP